MRGNYMNKLMKTVLGSLCAITVLVGSGCDDGAASSSSIPMAGIEGTESMSLESVSSSGETNEQEDIFAGNYTEVSREEMDAFFKRIEHITFEQLVKENLGLQFSAEISGEVSDGVKKATGAITSTVQVERLNKEGQFHLQALEEEFFDNENTKNAIYLKEENLYRKRIEGEDIYKERENFSLENCFNGSDFPYPYYYIGLTWENPFTCWWKEVKEDWIQESTITCYLDETDSEYIKMKIRVTGAISFKDEFWLSATGDVTLIRVYTKDYRYVGGQSYWISSETYGGMKSVEQGTATVSSWDGTITPPDDLDSYLPTNS